MCQDVGHRVLDFLFDQFCFCLADRQIMPFAFIMVQDQQQCDRTHGKDHGKQCRPCLGERFVRNGRTGQSHDFRIDGIISKQRRGRHGAQSGYERHDRQGEQRRKQRRHNHFQKHLERFCSKVSGCFNRIVINSPDGVPQEQRMIRSTCKRHGEQYGVKACEPLFVHTGEEIRQPFCHQTVRIIKELVSGHQRDA